MGVRCFTGRVTHSELVLLLADGGGFEGFEKRVQSKCEFFSLRMSWFYAAGWKELRVLSENARSISFDFCKLCKWVQRERTGRGRPGPWNPCWARDGGVPAPC